MLSALPGLGARCFNGAHVRGCEHGWSLVCPSLCCPGVSKGGPYVPCLRVRACRRVGLTLGKRAAWLMLPMLRNSDAGLRF